MEKKGSAHFNPKKEVSVMAWITDDRGSVLLVRQAVGQRFWTLPGGKVKRVESLERALRREVREETGLTVSTLTFRELYDRPKRGAIAILYKATVKREMTRMHFPIEEIADIGFFDDLPPNATPSAEYFWEFEQAKRSAAPPPAKPDEIKVDSKNGRKKDVGKKEVGNRK